MIEQEKIVGMHMTNRNFNNDSELVIGIVSTVGTNSSEIKACIVDSLNKFNYKSNKVKVSEDILSQFVVNLPDFSGDEYKRISFLWIREMRFAKRLKMQQFL